MSKKTLPRFRQREALIRTTIEPTHTEASLILGLGTHPDYYLQMIFFLFFWFWRERKMEEWEFYLPESQSSCVLKAWIDARVQSECLFVLLRAFVRKTREKDDFGD